MPHDPSAFANTDYWFDSSVPDAGKIMAEYGHIVDVYLLTPEQRRASSTLRELLGLIRMVSQSPPAPLDQSLRTTGLFVDNQAVEKIMVKGSRIITLHRMVRDLVATLDANNVRASIIWTGKDMPKMRIVQ